MPSIKERLANLPVVGAPLYKLYRRNFARDTYYDPPSDWLPRLLGEGPLQIVQIGSNDGATGDPLHALIKRRRRWRGLFVEPVPYLFERLRANYGDDPRFRFENAAINDGSQAAFYSVDPRAARELPDLPSWYDQLGSFDRGHILRHLDGALGPYVVATPIAGTTLPDLLAKHQIREIALLHIDTEGYDWRVLSQLDLSRVRPAVILVEHKHLGDDERAAMLAFLRPDYRVVRLRGDLLAMRRDAIPEARTRGLIGQPV